MPCRPVMMSRPDKSHMKKKNKSTYKILRQTRLGSDRIASAWVFWIRIRIGIGFLDWNWVRVRVRVQLAAISRTYCTTYAI